MALFRNGEKLSVFIDVAAVERATDPGGRGEQLSQLLDRLADGRSLHRATAYLSGRSAPSREGDRAQVIRDIGFHVVEAKGASVSVALAVDVVSAAEDTDVLTIVSGDSSLEPAIAAARLKGARVEVVVCPGTGSDGLTVAADSAVAIGELGSSARGQRPGRPDRPRPANARLDRSPQPRPAPAGRGRSRTSRPPVRRQRSEQERQEWPTPPPPSPEEMGIDPATRVRPQPAGRPAPRPAPRSTDRAAPRRAPRSAPHSVPRIASQPADGPRSSLEDDSPPASAPDSSPSFTVLEGERLSSPRSDSDDDNGGSKSD